MVKFSWVSQDLRPGTSQVRPATSNTRTPVVVGMLWHRWWIQFLLLWSCYFIALHMSLYHSFVVLNACFENIYRVYVSTCMMLLTDKRLTSDVYLTSVCLTSACLSRTSDLTREQRGQGRLKLAHYTWLGHHYQSQKVKGQLAADVLSSQHAGTGATWRINTKILSTYKGRRRIVSPRAQLVTFDVCVTFECLSKI